MIPLFKEKLYLLKKENNSCDVTRALMLEVLEETFIDLNWFTINEDEETQDFITSENEKLISEMKSRCLTFANQIVQCISEELFNGKPSEIVNFFFFFFF